MVQGVIFIAVLQLGNFFTKLPWGLYRHFVIEERFGFNRMQPKDFFLDSLKMGFLSLFLGLPLLLGLFALIQYFRLWWLWGFLAVAGYPDCAGVAVPDTDCPVVQPFLSTYRRGQTRQGKTTA